jgi:RimJ/RimL family protein N-acetyltransferase
MQPPELFATQRLILRRPVTEDAEAIFREYAQDPEVTRYLTWEPNRSIEQTSEFLRQCRAAWEQGLTFQWAITPKEDGRLLGMIGFRRDGFKAEFGYVLARASWGRGYATEALRPLVDWTLSQREIRRVWAVCDVENQASARVLEKVGMVREGVLRRWSLHPTRSKEPRDCYCYAKVK